MAKSKKIVKMWQPEITNTEGALKAFAAEIVQLKHRAGALGLLKTMHALEEPVTAVGYEIAELMERKK